MLLAEGILCNRTHEFLVEKDGYYYIGLTDYALKKLGEIVFLELPKVGTSYSKGEAFGTVESLKDAFEMYMLIGGTVEEVNDDALNNIDFSGENSCENSWFIKVKSDSAHIDSLDLLDYEDYLEEV